MLFIKEVVFLEKLSYIFFDFKSVVNENLKKQKDPKVNLSQLRIMNLIRRNKNLVAREIAEIIDITPASMATNIDYLVKNGWLTKTPSKKDKRQLKLKLTVKGKAKALAVSRFVLPEVSKMFSNLTAEDKENLFKILDKIENRVDSNNSDLIKTTKSPVMKKLRIKEANLIKNS